MPHIVHDDILVVFPHDTRIYTKQIHWHQANPGALPLSLLSSASPRVQNIMPPPDNNKHSLIFQTKKPPAPKKITESQQPLFLSLPLCASTPKATEIFQHYYMIPPFRNNLPSIQASSGDCVYILSECLMPEDELRK